MVDQILPLNLGQLFLMPRPTPFSDKRCLLTYVPTGNPKGMWKMSTEDRDLLRIVYLVKVNIICSRAKIGSIERIRSDNIINFAHKISDKWRYYRMRYGKYLFHNVMLRTIFSYLSRESNFHVIRIFLYLLSKIESVKILLLK